MFKRLFKVLASLFLLALLVLGLFWQWCHFARPPRKAETADLAPGARYQRIPRESPRPLLIHVVQIDLSTPGLSLLATPPSPSQGHPLRAATVSEFLVHHQLSLAINASSFSPWEPGAFLLRDYYPHSGDPVTPAGTTVSRGQAYGSPSPNLPHLVVLPDRLEIGEGDLPPGTQQAVTGLSILVKNGAVPPSIRSSGPLHPRTAVALSKDGGRLWLIVVDGRQKGYSEGMTEAELAYLCLELGAYSALNLDGGGSSTLVLATPKGPRVLNSPIHTGLPGRERPVANHLGLRFASPVPRNG